MNIQSIFKKKIATLAFPKFIPIHKPLMGRKSIRETRRLEIIKVFYKVAKKEGLENTSIAKIAAVMGINPSLIIHYFQTKDELTYALIDYTLERYLTLYSGEKNSTPPTLDTLKAVVDDLFSRKWNRLFDDGLFYSSYALTFREPKVKQMYRNLTNTLRIRLTHLIERCDAASIIQVDQPKLTADLIFALVDGAYFYLSVSVDKKHFDEQITDYKKEAYRLLGISGDLPAR